jgi:glucosamine--fructose-6-phosphate aminotransferase (isomerizing)
MIGQKTLMMREVEQTPQVVARQERELARPLAELVSRLRKQPPDIVVTCARGSSAHAATFAKHLIERHLGLPVSAAAPSIARSTEESFAFAISLSC